MNKQRYEHLCSEAQAGRDAFIRHPKSHEEGRVTSCILASQHMVVETPQGETRCWDFHECEDLTDPRSRTML